ncbi:hypothetical protein H0H81_007213 [Sphagnurus paluster]|uniref:Uncharacterized protein n=1 Tax=Sphagnurus paluster TaxID=117069 RepID=A0A9P7FR75_9AGAR|nr:hypothetical protein H0H81_007213 [Sphagnurus paluster]
MAHLSKSQYELRARTSLISATGLPSNSLVSHINMALESKTAEFARLFDLFERIATRKSRAHADENNDIIIDDMRSMPLPPDLAPVVSSLAKLVGARNYRGEAHQEKKTNTRTRRNTVATTSWNNTDSSNEDDADSLEKFPLGKKYPFTFRLMLHKLYQLDDWAQKVKEVLERSQLEYKPLAESHAEEEKRAGEDQEIEGEKVQDGRVHFKAGTATGSRKPPVRPRAHSVITPTMGLLSTSPKSPQSCGPAEGDIRAVKKRCVGRRKSLNGPLSGEAGKIGGGWVYDSAVSSSEFTGPREAMEVKAFRGATLSTQPPWGTGTGKVAGKRRVSFSSMANSQQGDSVIATRRRALSVMNNQATQAQRKRRLEL